MVVLKTDRELVGSSGLFPCCLSHSVYMFTLTFPHTEVCVLCSQESESHEEGWENGVGKSRQDKSEPIQPLSDRPVSKLNLT